LPSTPGDQHVGLLQEPFDDGAVGRPTTRAHTSVKIWERSTVYTRGEEQPRHEAVLYEQPVGAYLLGRATWWVTTTASGAGSR
jgi:hypothetical protein